MRLLIAEDDVDLNDIIVRKLTAEGFLVDACHDGDEALSYLLVADYDVAVLDIRRVSGGRRNWRTPCRTPEKLLRIGTCDRAGCPKTNLS